MLYSVVSSCTPENSAIQKLLSLLLLLILLLLLLVVVVVAYKCKVSAI